MVSDKLTKCKTCGAQIAKSAKTCPSCGAKVRKGHPVLIGVLVVIVLLAAISALGGSKEPQKVAAHSQVQGATAEATATTAATKAAEQTTVQTENKKTTFLVGEMVELNGVQVTLKGVTESKGSAYNKPNDGNVFVLCEFDIANNSDAEIAISSMMSFDAYCDDYACTYSLGALLEKGNKNQLDGSVAAGKKFNGVVGYEVPADWKELEISFTPDFWSGKDITFIATNG